MNDRCVSVLDNYDIEVLRTWKGRGAILCETSRGILILKEYAGHKDKIAYQSALLDLIQSRGFQNVESIIRNKEGELFSQDQDGTAYVLKTYFEGRECNVRDMEECRQAVCTLAKLHSVSASSGNMPGAPGQPGAYQEFEKHNKELRKVRKFLKDKSQKTDFEIYLMKSFDYFFNLALQITEELRFHSVGFAGEEAGGENSCGVICHGDYQYHNLIISDRGMNIINFEKCVKDSPVRDLYLFMRKLLEKSSWSQAVGYELLTSYEQEKTLTKEDYMQLYYRLSYPEKFWKIVNFYFNSGKAWIPGRNMEKLQKVIEQETEKLNFLESYKERYHLF